MALPPGRDTHLPRTRRAFCSNWIVAVRAAKFAETRGSPGVQLGPRIQRESASGDVGGRAIRALAEISCHRCRSEIDAVLGLEVPRRNLPPHVCRPLVSRLLVVGCYDQRGLRNRASLREYGSNAACGAASS